MLINAAATAAAVRVNVKRAFINNFRCCSESNKRKKASGGLWQSRDRFVVILAYAKNEVRPGGGLQRLSEG